MGAYEAVTHVYLPLAVDELLRQSSIVGPSSQPSVEKERLLSRSGM